MRPAPLALLALTGLSLSFACTAAGSDPDPKPSKPISEAQASAAKHADAAFTAKLHGTMREQPGNLFYSPASLRMALGMTFAGARGDTADEMGRALELRDDAHDVFATELRDWNGRSGAGVKLRVSNRLWAKEGIGFKPDFLTVTRDRYGAPLQSLDFGANPEKSRTQINAWVEERTEHKIKDLMPKGSVTSDTRLVLTNAVYFKADWKHAFPATATKSDRFFVTASSPVQAPLMQQNDMFGYGETDSVQLLEMPYVAGDMSMVVAVPKARNELAAVERTLDAATLEKWTAALHTTEVTVTFPKFETTSSFAMERNLSTLGMRSAFTPGVADFSGMDGTRQLSIQAVMQKAFVAVDEKGTEAAAATAVAIAATGVKAPPRQVRVDQPFLFFIRDTKSGAIMFFGRITDPTK